MVKFGRIVDGVIWLIPANAKFKPWPCKAEDQFEAVGVVIEVIKRPVNDYSKMTTLPPVQD